MNIHQSTRLYEEWLASHVRVIKPDLEAKHKQMRVEAFRFLRGTFYRWAQIFPVLCPDAASAPKLLAVGDLHVENYGTWRDAEGRLVWGINDFDEAFPLPYTFDLVRLTTSAMLEESLDRLSISPDEISGIILEGYEKCLEERGKPFVLSERNRWLRLAVTGRLRDPTLFWSKFVEMPGIRKVPTEALRLLKSALPEKGLEIRIGHRQAGMGSLGRERYSAVADWCGGKVAREIKPLLPSACVFANGSRDKKIYYHQILVRSVRAADPYLVVRGGWVLRRLSPYCSRVEFAQLDRIQSEEKLLRAMGRELANVHLGTPRAIPSVLQDLRARNPKWLRKSSELMLEATLEDWREWRNGSG
jgi:hypothetical protein